MTYFCGLITFCCGFYQVFGTDLTLMAFGAGIMIAGLIAESEE